MNYFFKALNPYANFKGRSNMKDYWFFVLIYTGIYIVLAIIDEFLLDGMPITATIFVLGILVPSIAITTRRLHDTGKSGWWQLLYIIPLIGFIVVTIFLLTGSELANNKYGTVCGQPIDEENTLID